MNDSGLYYELFYTDSIGSKGLFKFSNDFYKVSLFSKYFLAAFVGLIQELLLRD